MKGWDMTQDAIALLFDHLSEDEDARMALAVLVETLEDACAGRDRMKGLLTETVFALRALADGLVRGEDATDYARAFLDAEPKEVGL